MATVNVDGKEYDFDALSAEAKQLLQSIQFVDAEMRRLVAQNAVLKVARLGFSTSLKEALTKTPEKLLGDTIKLG